MDTILDVLRSESFEGIRIDSYIRQGSSREGLKVVEPNEFDAMLEFHIEGLEGKITEESILDKTNRHVSGFCFMKIDGVDMAYLQRRYPRLFQRGLFVEQGGRILLSLKSLYERFFNKNKCRANCKYINESKEFLAVFLFKYFQTKHYLTDNALPLM